MRNLLRKEIKLAASPLSFLFLAFGAMMMIPNYPVLVGAFFICFGIFHSFQTMRENNDIVFSALLPIPKKDIVKGKFLFCLLIEFCGFVVMAALIVLRMTLLKEIPVYLEGKLLAANFCCLGFVLVIFALFNLVFLRGFFKTGYYFGKPFIFFIVISMLAIGVAEALPYIPGCSWVNSFGFDNIGLQLATLGAGAVIFALVTVLSYVRSVKTFLKIDL